jgi:hypothetical protein
MRPAMPRTLPVTQCLTLLLLSGHAIAAGPPPKHTKAETVVPSVPQTQLTRPERPAPARKPTTALQRFGNEKQANDLRYFYAEVLWTLRDWKEAARQYGRVIERDPRGKWARSTESFSESSGLIAAIPAPAWATPVEPAPWFPCAKAALASTTEAVENTAMAMATGRAVNKRIGS